MTDKRLKEIIDTVLESGFKRPVSEICDSDNLRDDIGMDSLDLADLTARIEESFGVDVFVGGIVSTVKEIKDKLCL